MFCLRYHHIDKGNWGWGVGVAVWAGGEQGKGMSDAMF